MTEDIKDKLMNGSAAASAVDPLKQAFMADPGAVRLAESLLADVKSGKVSSLAVICVTPTGQVQWPAHGVQATELYLGAGIFQRQIEGMVTGARKNSGIIRPNG